MKKDITYVKELIQKLVSGGLAIEKDFGELLEIEGWVVEGVTFTQMWNDDFKGTTVGRMLLPVFFGHIIDLMSKDEVLVEDISDAMPGFSTNTVRWVKEQLADGIKPSDVTRTKPVKANGNGSDIETLTVSFTITGAEKVARWKKIVAALAHEMAGVSLGKIAEMETTSYIEDHASWANEQLDEKEALVG